MELELQLSKAIVHVLDTDLSQPMLSDRLLRLAQDEGEYLAGHIQKVYTSDDCKNCTFLPESQLQALLLDQMDFVLFSQKLANMIFEVMQLAPSIPSADLIVMFCSINGRDSLAVLKMNYKTGYSHYYEQIEGENCNSLVKQRTLLPGSTSRADEAFLVDLTDGSIKLLEKKYQVDGAKEFYLSNRILQSTQATPEKAKFKAVQEAATQAVRESYQENKLADAQMTEILREEAAEGEVTVQRVKERIEEEFPLATPAFVEEMKNIDLEPEEPVAVSPSRVKRMETQSIKTTCGIEIKIPTSLSNGSEDFVEFINAPDGTISMLIKGVLL